MAQRSVAQLGSRGELLPRWRQQWRFAALFAALEPSLAVPFLDTACGGTATAVLAAQMPDAVETGERQAVACAATNAASVPAAVHALAVLAARYMPRLTDMPKRQRILSGCASLLP